MDTDKKMSRCFHCGTWDGMLETYKCKNGQVIICTVCMSKAFAGVVNSHHDSAEEIRLLEDIVKNSEDVIKTQDKIIEGLQSRVKDLENRFQESHDY